MKNSIYTKEKEGRTVRVRICDQALISEKQMTGIRLRLNHLGYDFPGTGTDLRSFPSPDPSDDAGTGRLPSGLLGRTRYSASERCRPCRLTHGTDRRADHPPLFLRPDQPPVYICDAGRHPKQARKRSDAFRCPASCHKKEPVADGFLEKQSGKGSFRVRMAGACRFRGSGRLASVVPRLPALSVLSFYAKALTILYVRILLMKNTYSQVCYHHSCRYQYFYILIYAYLKNAIVMT